MNNNEVISSLSVAWITDRVPTQDDTFDDWIFTMRDGEVVLNNLPWDVKEGEPWQPIHKPEPYVKPKRWVVDWIYYCNCYVITDGELRIHLYQLQSRDDAQRICDIYNEVLP